MQDSKTLRLHLQLRKPSGEQDTHSVPRVKCFYASAVGQGTGQGTSQGPELEPVQPSWSSPVTYPDSF